MSSETRPNAVRTPVSAHRNRTVGGAALIGIGLLLTLGQVVETDWLGLLFLPVLGLIFLLWGIGTRNAGLLIPGGILSGIGLGAFLTEGALQGIPNEQTGGAFLLCFGAGWMVITVLSALFTDEPLWWPLIPGSILALIGGSLLAGGIALEIVTVLGDVIRRAWPVALIAFGLYLILRRRSAQE